jgi:hypothetical protein
LANPILAAKTALERGWIRLDFLGFSRPNLDFSMGYAGIGEKLFSASRSAAETPENGMALRGEAGSLHARRII